MKTPPTTEPPKAIDSKRVGDCPAASCSAVPEDVAREIRDTWKAAREAGGEMQAFRIIERMVDRLGYGRTENNPPLLPNAGHPAPPTQKSNEANQ